MRQFLAAILIATPITAFAEQSTVQVDHAWSRAAMVGHEGVVYLTISDTGTSDTLAGVTTPVAAAAALHQSIDDHGVMKMRPAGPLAIEPGKPVTLAPGGYHIMLTGLKQTLKQGDSFPVTLTFAKAGQVTVIATVQTAGAMPAKDQSKRDVMGDKPMSSGGKQP